MTAGAERKLFLVKLVHTVIWAFFVFVIGYILYAGLWGEVDAYVWIAVALVIFEGFVLAWNGGKCPLTLVGARYSDSHDDNFDIFLPRWLAKNNKVIFTAIFAVGLLIVLYRAFS